jgi:putative lipase involved disintegration of autophagic bodies
LREAEPALKAALQDNPDFRLIVTGHSLGAGTAELITLTILSGNVDFVDPAKTSVQCIALAPPPVYR